MTDDARMRDAWDVYLYARDLLAKRMSYGMIAQSMLLIVCRDCNFIRSSCPFLRKDVLEFRYVGPLPANIEEAPSPAIN